MAAPYTVRSVTWNRSGIHATPELKTVLYQHVTPEIVRVAMKRPEGPQRAGPPDDGRPPRCLRRQVIILSGEGLHFSSGHDMRGGTGLAFADVRPLGTWANFDAPGRIGGMGQEEEIDLQMCRQLRVSRAAMPFDVG
jgi:enoyl-CoA hydratase